MLLSQMVLEKAEIEKLITDTVHLDKLKDLKDRLHEINVKIAAKWDSVDENSLD